MSLPGPEVVATIAGVVTAVWAALVILRKVLRKAGKTVGKLNSAAETLLGRDAIVHPDTGAVLAPATPSLGQRMAGLELAVHALTVVQTDVADLRRELHDHIKQSPGC